MHYPLQGGSVLSIRSTRRKMWRADVEHEEKRKIAGYQLLDQIETGCCYEMTKCFDVRYEVSK